MATGSPTWDQFTLHGAFPHLFPRPSASAMLQQLRAMIDEDFTSPPKVKPYVPMQFGIITQAEKQMWAAHGDKVAPTQPCAAKGHVSNMAKPQKVGRLGDKMTRSQPRPRATQGSKDPRVSTRPKSVSRPWPEIKPSGADARARGKWANQSATPQQVGPLGFSRRRRKHFKQTLETIYEHRTCFYCPMWRWG